MFAGTLFEESFPGEEDSLAGFELGETLSGVFEIIGAEGSGRRRRGISSATFV
jgi:hypothetical protein